MTKYVVYQVEFGGDVDGTGPERWRGQEVVALTVKPKQMPLWIVTTTSVKLTWRNQNNGIG